MIIKRWNSGTSAFVEEYPKTKAQLIRNNGNTDWVFDANDKLKTNYLPDAVFDSLRYYNTSAGNINDTASRELIAANLVLLKLSSDDNLTYKSVVGSYFVVSSAGTISDVTGIERTTAEIVVNYPSYTGPDRYVTLRFKNEQLGTTTATSVSLQIGDWFIIEQVTGLGTQASPWIFIASVINNTYENASTSVNGIVRLSSRSTYAALTGNDVVTEGVLKTVIDQASFAASGHVHGNILNDGTITTSTAAGSGQHLVITSTGNLIQQSAIELGTSTTTFLNNAGAWTTPIGTTYSAGEGITLSSTTFRMTYPLYVQTTTPTTTIAGAIWYDIN